MVEIVSTIGSLQYVCAEFWISDGTSRKKDSSNREFLQTAFYFYFFLTRRGKAASLVSYKVIILFVMLFHRHRNILPLVLSPKVEAHRQPYFAETLTAIAIMHADGSNHNRRKRFTLKSQGTQVRCSIVQSLNTTTWDCWFCYFIFNLLLIPLLRGLSGYLWSDVGRRYDDNVWRGLFRLRFLWN